MRQLLIGSAILAAALAAVPAKAQDMVFTSWGGTTQDAQKQAWAVPFTEESGVNVLMDGPTDYGKLKAMVESGNVGWDVVDVEYDFAIKAAQDGLLEAIDFAVVDRDAIDPRFVTDHAVGSFYYSFVIGYNADTYADTTPSSWADLFDLEAFPGKRTFYKWSAPGVLEIALLADGVAPEELYPLDLDRAFAKLDTIKSEIIWWDSGAQSQQLLASGEAPLGQFWNGRVAAVAQSGANVGISWEQNLTAADVLVVPKGAPNKDAAMKFLAVATAAEPQAEFAKASAYAPINVDSKDLMDAETVETLPDSHTESQIDLDMQYWAENRDEIADRWYAWQAQ
ncbi:ABC transporter substrate-binding protein [Lutibaculum baratangense]|uniref:ABC transporter, periplasmic spermidine putrescine-binding protein potD n=1 Tax=Lutibaculum baratangense AMV1 TaxID=631454 RepID=V4REC8_9HYPH|nr:ABC transporter substrate-binding protein [Lutibaculum baratangense]ESR23749.1 ABC transporter, periplasmic spermidine putrescine-binding protein potD [Lutibaculum baratangense AMV1]